MIRTRVALRALLKGRYHFAWLIVRSAFYGMTHRTCRQCGKLKGLNTHANCYSCQYANFVKAMEEEPRG